MKVTNLMEEFVKSQVDDMYNRLKKEGSAICDCENCRTDTLCYVLNRVPPKYAVSGRGVNHAQRELETRKQISADVDAVVMEGIRLIGSSKRPNHNSSYISSTEPNQEQTPFFYFPMLSGYVYDGTTYESLVNAKVTLFMEKQKAQMIDSTWQNPYTTFKAMEGAYNFCVKPEKAEKENQTRDFYCELQIEAEGYDSVSYAFSIPITSKIMNEFGGSSNYSLKIQDLVLFPKSVENAMERYVRPLDEK